MGIKSTKNATHIGTARDIKPNRKSTGLLQVKRTNDRVEKRGIESTVHSEHTFIKLPYSMPLRSSIAWVLDNNNQFPGVNFNPEQISCFEQRLIQLCSQ